MKILFIAERLHPAIGGVERHVSRLSDCLIASGHEITCVAPNHDSNLSPYEAHENLEIFRIPTGGHTRANYLLAWKWWFLHRDLLRRSDIIHFHDVYAMLHWFGPIHILIPPRKRFLTCHGYEMAYPIPHRARLYRRIACGLSAGTLCVGHYLERWFHISSDAVSYGAVDCLMDRSIDSIPDNAVFVGRLAKDTGVDIVFRGLGMYQQQSERRVALTVCGDGPLKETLMAIAHDEDLFVNFLGPVSNPLPVIQKASMVFAPGYLAMLQAFMCRRPVIVAHINPVREDYYGLMSPEPKFFDSVGSPQELVELLSSYSPSPDQLERAERYAREHSWERLAGVYLKLWSIA